MKKDEVVITSAVRTAVGSLGKSLKNITGEKLIGNSIIGSLTTAAQTAITSVGTLASLDISGALDVDGATTLDGLTVAEASTFNGVLSATNDGNTPDKIGDFKIGRNASSIGSIDNLDSFLLSKK
mgnify:CR=1 FL=1